MKDYEEEKTNPEEPQYTCENCIECRFNYLGCYCGLTDNAIEPNDEACNDFIAIDEEDKL